VGYRDDDFDRVIGAQLLKSLAAPAPQQLIDGFDVALFPCLFCTPLYRDASVSLGKAERTFLGVLAQFPEGRTRTQLAMLSHYSAKSGGVRNALGALRSAGLVGRAEPIRITEEGLAAFEGQYEPLRQGDALIEHWMQTLGKAERVMLQILLDMYPRSMTRDGLGEAAGYSPLSGGVRNAFGRLRTLDLINRGQDIRADDAVAQEVGRG
jgi:hypothetical protein